MLEVYNKAKRDWSLAGVSVTTDDVQLLQCLDMVEGKFEQKK